MAMKLCVAALVLALADPCTCNCPGGPGTPDAGPDNPGAPGCGGLTAPRVTQPRYGEVYVDTRSCVPTEPTVYVGYCWKRVPAAAAYELNLGIGSDYEMSIDVSNSKECNVVTCYDPGTDQVCHYRQADPPGLSYWKVGAVKSGCETQYSGLMEIEIIEQQQCASALAPPVPANTGAGGSSAASSATGGIGSTGAGSGGAGAANSGCDRCCPAVWEDDSFDALALGPLAGQHGWTLAASDRASAVVVGDASAGQVLEIDPASGATIVMVKPVPAEDAGCQVLEFDVRVDAAVDASIAKLEVQTDPASGWSKKFQIYFGTGMRLNYGADGSAVGILPSTVTGRWYHVRCDMNLGSGLLDVQVDGVTAASGIPMHSGPIVSLGLSGWDLPGTVFLDRLHAERL
jgi:hypothetical protein